MNLVGVFITSLINVLTAMLLISQNQDVINMPNTMGNTLQQLKYLKLDSKVHPTL